MVAVHRLIETFPELIESTDRGFTPLQLAVIKRQESIVDVLLTHGADPNNYGQIGRSPLSIVIEDSRNTNIIDNLIRHGAKLSPIDNAGNTLLHMAFSNPIYIWVIWYIAKVLNRNADDIIEELIDNTNIYGVTPYHVAVYCGIKYIIDKYTTKDRVNLPDIRGKTPMFYVSDAAIAKKLLPLVEDVNAVDKSGNRLSEYITSLGDSELITEYIDRGGVLTQNDVDRIPNDDIREFVIYHYNRKHGRVSIERWKDICNNNRVEQMDILRNALRLILSDDEMKKYDTFEKMCEFINSNGFKQAVDRYRKYVMDNLGSNNEYDPITLTELWEYRPEYLTCFREGNAKYCLPADYIIHEVTTKNITPTNGSYNIVNPFTRETFKLPVEEYQRLQTVVSTNPKNALAQLLEEITPSNVSSLRYWPTYLRRVYQYNQQTNDSLNETFVVNLARSMDYSKISTFLEFVREQTGAILDDNIVDIIHDLILGNSDYRNVVIAIVDTLTSMRSTVPSESFSAFDDAVRIYSSGTI
jgi:hypothetical protein